MKRQNKIAREVNSKCNLNVVIKKILKNKQFLEMIIITCMYTFCNEQSLLNHTNIFRKEGRKEGGKEGRRELE